jgi:AAA15 family ATPase/GTPase
MLIEFKVKNFLSFKDEATLSMVAAPITEHEENTFQEKKGLTLLKSAVVYGANASGKSNLFEALHFMRSFVIHSSKESQAGEDIDVIPFELSSETENELSWFEISFLENDTIFRYGFSVSSKKVTSEWLYYKPKTKEIPLFERKNDKFDIHATRFKEGIDISAKTRENTLFLSAVAQWNGKVSERLISWFKKLTIISGSQNQHKQKSIDMLKTTEHNTQVLSLLQSVGINIQELKVETRKINLDMIPPFFSESEKKELLNQELSRLVVTKKKFSKNGIEEKDPISWSIGRESEGTQKLVELSGPIFNALNSHQVLIIDEFDIQLHPLLSKALITLFHSNEINPARAQFIIATHDTNLLSKDLFRRDQIWFTEKDPFEASHLYSLIEYKLEKNAGVRKDADYAKNYIAGRYGAIPYINTDDLKALLSEGSGNGGF